MATKYITDIEIEGSLKVNGNAVGLIPNYPVYEVTLEPSFPTPYVTFDESVSFVDGQDFYISVEGNVIGPFEAGVLSGEITLRSTTVNNTENYPSLPVMTQVEGSDNKFAYNLFDASIQLVFQNDIPHLCHIRVAHTTAQGTYDYGFNISVKSGVSGLNQLTDVAKYLYSKNVRDEIPASGTYTEGNNVYLVTGVKPLSNNMMQINMVKLSDGTTRTIETGMVTVSYDVEW